MTSQSEKLKRFEHVLSALNPKLVLRRGYGYVQLPNRDVVPSKEQFNKLPSGARLTIQFHDGQGEVTKAAE